VDRLFPTVTMAPSYPPLEANFGDDPAKPFEYDIHNCPGLELACIWEEMKWKWTGKNGILNETHYLAFLLLLLSHLKFSLKKSILFSWMISLEICNCKLFKIYYLFFVVKICFRFYTILRILLYFEYLLINRRMASMKLVEQLEEQVYC
jgi:hypothetical protein